jgi:hypothetical protein
MSHMANSRDRTSVIVFGEEPSEEFGMKGNEIL